MQNPEIGGKNQNGEREREERTHVRLNEGRDGRQKDGFQGKSTKKTEIGGIDQNRKRERGEERT